MTGALAGSVTCELFGRRKSMLLDAVLFIAGWLLIGLPTQLPLLLIGRFITGHMAGSSMMCSPIFVAETSHPSFRGLTSCLLIVLYCGGFTLSMLLGALFPWRTVVLIACSFPVLSFLILIFMKESPTWLARKGRIEEAKSSLMFYRGDAAVVRDELERIRDNLTRIQKQNESFGNSFISRMKTKLRRMRNPGFLKPFLLLNVMLNIGLDWGGFPALAFYMHTILENITIPFDTYTIAIFLAAYRTVVAIAFSFVVSKLPRRITYLTAGSMSAVALAIQAGYAWFSPYFPEAYKSYLTWIPLAGMIIQYTGFSLGYGTIVYGLQGEILPSDMRSFGSGLLGFMDNIVLFFAVKTIPFFMSTIGVGGMFFTYCCCTLFNLVVCFFVMPETRGMSLEDIEDFYTAMKQARSRLKSMSKP